MLVLGCPGVGRWTYRGSSDVGWELQACGPARLPDVGVRTPLAGRWTCRGSFDVGGGLVADDWPASPVDPGLWAGEEDVGCCTGAPGGPAGSEAFFDAGGGPVVAEVVPGL